MQSSWDLSLPRCLPQDAAFALGRAGSWDEQLLCLQTSAGTAHVLLAGRQRLHQSTADCCRHPFCHPTARLTVLPLTAVCYQVASPKHRAFSIYISDSAVITRRDGILKFMFRVADIRRSQVQFKCRLGGLVAAQAKLPALPGWPWIEAVAGSAYQGRAVPDQQLLSVDQQ